MTFVEHTAFLPDASWTVSVYVLDEPGDTSIPPFTGTLPTLERYADVAPCEPHESEAFCHALMIDGYADKTHDGICADTCTAGLYTCGWIPTFAEHTPVPPLPLTVMRNACVVDMFENVYEPLCDMLPTPSKTTLVALFEVHETTVEPPYGTDEGCVDMEHVG